MVPRRLATSFECKNRKAVRTYQFGLGLITRHREIAFDDIASSARWQRDGIHRVHPPTFLRSLRDLTNSGVPIKARVASRASYARRPVCLSMNDARLRLRVFGDEYRVGGGGQHRHGDAGHPYRQSRAGRVRQYGDEQDRHDDDQRCYAAVTLLVNHSVAPSGANPLRPG